jgi:hypothetical protein
MAATATRAIRSTVASIVPGFGLSLFPRPVRFLHGFALTEADALLPRPREQAPGTGVETRHAGPLVVVDDQQLRPNLVQAQAPDRR